MEMKNGSQYCVETLSYLIEQDCRAGRLSNYLNNSEITPDMRNKAVSYIMKVGEQEGIEIEAAQTAVIILDRFLEKVGTKPTVLRLVSIVSLLIAQKFQGPMKITVNQVFTLTGGRYSVNDIKLIELFVLQKLNWKLNTPTVGELARLLLEITGLNYDFSKIIERANAFGMVCYADYNLSQFLQVEISIASLVCALEQLGQLNFRNQWLRMLRSKLNLGLEGADVCKRSLVEKLLSETPEYDHCKLECLRRNNIIDVSDHKD
mmetsp:Transcript_14730/g.21459  ORF Transcript_14730/g.21459 Transcript_14730/m.21459 type:complete len:262 (-) Transcript_14730:69-854(-)